jgi:uncharacterized protein (TIGR02996 family)
MPDHLFATTRQDEYGFLSAITTSLSDISARSSYADWLDSQGDNRSSFVRDLSKAIESISDNPVFPTSDGLERSWTNMLGLSLFEAIAEFKLAEYLGPICRLARPMVTFETTIVEDDAIAVGGSKLGGLPDLPANVEWPKWSGGRLGFVGQFDLSELALTQATRELPDDGVLSFFSFADPDGFPRELGDTRVMFPNNGTLGRSRGP